MKDGGNVFFCYYDIAASIAGSIRPTTWKFHNNFAHPSTTLSGRKTWGFY